MILYIVKTIKMTHLYSYKRIFSSSSTRFVSRYGRNIQVFILFADRTSYQTTLYNLQSSEIITRLGIVSSDVDRVLTTVLNLQLHPICLF